MGIYLRLGHDGALCPCYPTPPPPPAPSGVPTADVDPRTGEDLRQENVNEELHAPAFGGIDVDDFEPPSHEDPEGNPWITIVHTNGIHYLRAKFCLCRRSESRYLQFLDAGLYSATKKKPRTVFTFQTLDDFYIEALECKTAARNYYTKLRRLTSKVFPHLVPVCYCISHNIMQDTHKKNRIAIVTCFVFQGSGTISSSENGVGMGINRSKIFPREVS